LLARWPLACFAILVYLILRGHLAVGSRFGCAGAALRVASE